MLKNPLDLVFMPADVVVLAFGGPRAPAPQPLPTNPAEDEARKKEVADAANQAALEAQAGGVRQNIRAGALGNEDENVVALGGSARRRGTKRGASSDLGAF